MVLLMPSRFILASKEVGFSSLAANPAEIGDRGVVSIIAGHAWNSFVHLYPKKVGKKGFHESSSGRVIPSTSTTTQSAGAGVPGTRRRRVLSARILLRIPGS